MAPQTFTTRRGTRATAGAASLTRGAFDMRPKPSVRITTAPAALAIMKYETETPRAPAPGNRLESPLSGEI